MFETTSEARHLHSCSALEAAFFPSDILFKPQLRMQLKACSCKSDEFRTVSEQKHLVFVTGFKKSKENSRTPNAPIC